MTRNFTRILVPTDFSAPSNAALALAKRMATMSGASLHLLHVLEDPFAAAGYATDVYTPPPAEITESWLKGAQGLLDTQLTPDEQVILPQHPGGQVRDAGAGHRQSCGSERHRPHRDGDAWPWRRSPPADGKRRRASGPRGTVPGANGEGHRESAV